MGSWTQNVIDSTRHKHYSSIRGETGNGGAHEKATTCGKQTVYGQTVRLTDVFVKRSVSNPKASELLAMVSKYSAAAKKESAAKPSKAQKKK